MEQRIFHGNIRPNDLAQALVAEFNRGSLRTRQFGYNQEIVVQIASSQGASSGGQTGLTVTLRAVPDGVAVEIGKLSWLGLQPAWGKAPSGRCAARGICLAAWMILPRISKACRFPKRSGPSWIKLPAAWEQPSSCRTAAQARVRLLPGSQPGRRAYLHRLRRSAGPGSAAHLPQLRLCGAHQRNNLPQLQTAFVGSRIYILRSQACIGAEIEAASQYMGIGPAACAAFQEGWDFSWLGSRQPSSYLTTGRVRNSKS